MKLPAGHALGGFEIIDQIGRGAMGTVYRARQVALEREVALKVLDRSDDDPAAFERFRREAIQVAKLQHPNILPVFDFGQHEDITYIAMELADGGTLAAQIGQPMAPAKAIQVLKPAALAIDYAHEAKVIHRDVKPTNLLFDASGRLFLSDFGLALMRDAKSSTWGQVVGTPWYMAPEQFRSQAEPASDVYALAVTLFQLLTGRVPFERENPLAVALAHLREPVPPARQWNPAVTDQVERALQRGLAKNPGQRFGRAIELLAAVAEALRQPALSSGAAAATQAPRPAVASPAAPPVAAGAVGAPSSATAPPAPAKAAAAPAARDSLGAPRVARPAPMPGRQVFESKPTIEWARGNIMLRDNRNGRLNVTEELTELTLSPPNQAQLLLMPIGVVQEVWAELRFQVAPEGGLLDLLWFEGTTPQSYCLRIDTQQGRLSIGVVPAAGAGEERWLGARNAPLAPGTDHTVLLVARNGAIEAYLDGRELAAVNDTTLDRGMVRLRMLPAAQPSPSKVLLRRIAFYRPPE